MGVGQAALKWFDSYLGGREQTVEISGVFSKFRTVTCGVPQGSILGPLLFLIYVNDMKAAVNCKLLLYADDSALLASSSDVSEIEEILKRELSQLVNGYLKIACHYTSAKLNQFFLTQTSDWLSVKN